MSRDSHGPKLPIATVASHLPFQVTSGDAHFRTSCFGCRPKTRADKPCGEGFAPATMDCQYKSSSCIHGGCHADGTKPGGN